MLGGTNSNSSKISSEGESGEQSVEAMPENIASVLCAWPGGPSSVRHFQIDVLIE